MIASGEARNGLNPVSDQRVPGADNPAKEESASGQST